MSSPERGPAGVRAAVAAPLGFAVVVAFAPAFGRTATATLGDPRYALAGAGVVAAVTVICLALATWTRLAAATRALAALTGIAGYVAVVAPPLTQLAGGPRRLVTSALPLDPVGPELATVVVVAGLATLAAVEAVLRSRPAPLLALAAPVLSVSAGCAVSAAVAGPPPWLGMAVILNAAVLLLLCRARSSHARVRWVAGTLALGVLVAGTALAGPALVHAAGRARPYDVRSLIDEPVRPRVTTSPLAQFAAMRAGRLPFALRIEADAPPERLRYVTLDRFDGTYWTTAARYHRAGLRLPESTVDGGGSLVTERVTVERAGPLGWLVSSGRPVEVSLAGLGVDQDSGDVVVPDDRQVPAGYTITSRRPGWDPELLDLATPAPPVGPAIRVPADLGATARDLAGGEYADAALRRLVDHFQRDGGYALDRSDNPPGGHGLLHIRRLLEVRRGTAEQYASAFAVLAAALGYDARVVVGFLPRAEGSGYRVSPRDVDAWVEVRYVDLGWVSYHPTPELASGNPNRADRADNRPVTATTPAPAAGPGTPAATDAAGVPGPATTTPGTSRVLVGAVAGVAVLLLGALLAVPLLKMFRRRRRRRGTADRRVLGAWREAVDRMTEAGLVAPRAATSGELAAAAGRRFDGRVAANAARLARLHDATAFGPAGTGSADADRAWRHADELRRDVRRSMGYGRRLLAVLSPRPVLPGGGRRRSGTAG